MFYIEKGLAVCEQLNSAPCSIFPPKIEHMTHVGIFSSEWSDQNLKHNDKSAHTANVLPWFIGIRKWTILLS